MAQQDGLAGNNQTPLPAAVLLAELRADLELFIDDRELRIANLMKMLDGAEFCRKDLADSEFLDVLGYDVRGMAIECAVARSCLASVFPCTADCEAV